MPIEISNNVTLSQQPNPGEEARTGKAETNSTKAEVETGKAVETVQVSENAKRLQTAFESISSLPTVDPKKVEAARNKIASGTLGIQGNEQQRLEAAEKIVDKLADVDDGIFGETKS